ncbi:ribosome small subunit-dependent GTPase A [Latilactobacillus curvatus]|uniref:Ribosome small subunit-dependent GTPase A n=1 Tax=Latilactobacillus curvatus TaxID=28038 RepID=A0AAJ5RIV5_LATCU|nr:ribosome small subunit-dependent GTPase A [Latilactobacillus curvatus]WDC92628.1 ribosome small subunit-dependent GTPase A [Latilactobacillus curvatus]
MQTLAANIATIFIVTSANQEFSEARLQRYLTMAWDSGATPVIVLSKTDLVSDSELTTFLDAVASVTFDSVPVITTGQTASNVAATFKPYLTAGQWVTFVGSSGVGKSTLINQLIKEPSVLTSGIRDDDDKGRHTTTNRQAYQTASGAFIVDTPGMRELGMTSSMSKALKTVFTDIETLAQDCRFKDCQHQSEPSCAVRAAIDAGSLMPERLADFNKLAIEADYSQLSAREIEQAKVKRLMGSLKTRPTKQN